ncbi:MAG: DUF4185 domain-containing protein [Candidatus Eremiobacteraeota bacterium]|nr:DUF4185 domain-containing protein [Candidatus Eremiobacteraeota bacterium]
MLQIRYKQVGKVNQLLGEVDKQFHTPTLSRTVTRYGLRGTDLGQSFEYNGQVYFLFGDTVGVEHHALDSIGMTNANDPSGGVKLDFVSQQPKTYVTIQPPGIPMGAFDTPVAGIVVDGKLYVVVGSGRTANPKGDVGYSVLTRVGSPITPTAFTPLGRISTLPQGHFLKMALHATPRPIPGLPAGGPYVLMWGTGWYRHSDAYLALRPIGSFERGTGTWYYAGPAGAPASVAWTHDETRAKPIVSNGTMGDISVTWCSALNVWLMTYDSRPPALDGIVFQWSTTPWGPWSSPQVIFNAVRDGAMGTFIHDPRIRPDDGLAGPVIGSGQAHPDKVRGGAYAPYVVERWTQLRGSELTIYFTLSTWNPYVVDLMRATFDVKWTNGAAHTFTPHPIPYPTRPI